MNEDERHPPRHPRDGQDTYWIRAKTQAAITHLRDIEDWAIGAFGGRVPGETDEEFEARLANAPLMVLAQRARECHEHITRRLKNGKRSSSPDDELTPLRLVQIAADGHGFVGLDSDGRVWTRPGNGWLPLPMNVIEERRGP